MKSIYTKILALAALSCMAACGYLDEEPLHYLQPDERFKEEAQMELALHMCYHYLPDGYASVNGSLLDAATDDAVYYIEADNVNKLARGEYSGANPILNYWDDCYKGIAQTFLVEDNLHYMNIPKGSSVTNAESYFAGKRREFGSEAKMLRAFFYFQLMKMYGGVPLVKNSMKMGDEMASLGRAPLADVVDYIVELCDQAADTENGHPAVVNATPGRWGRGAAKAIKAKAMVWAASDLYNTDIASPLWGYTSGTQAERRERALAALAEVLAISNFGLANTYDMFFLQANNAQFIKEFIVYKGRAKSNEVERLLFPPTLGGNGGIFPSQGLVDAFDKANGDPWTPQAAPDAMQWVGRDPRLAKIVFWNGTKPRTANTLYTYTGTDQTLDGFGVVYQRSTRTGYYLRKFADYASVDFDRATQGTTNHIFPLIRYADILLLYAEVMNELNGPTGTSGSYTLTAKKATENVRGRTGGITTALPDGITQTELRARIRNERRVELCFEEQRYFDLRRWKEGVAVLNNPVQGMKVTRNADAYTYEKVTVDASRRFTPAMYFAPIPHKEVVSLGIAQNPDW